MLNIRNGRGATALDQTQWIDQRQGYAVVPSGGSLGTECEVSINTGTLGTGNNTLSVASGSVLFDGGVVSVAAQNVDIDAGDASPRKDVVYIDSAGTAQVRKGSPASVPADAPGEKFQTWKPAPYDMHNVDSVVLAVVWVGATASSVTSSDLRDRRLSAESAFSPSATIAGSVPALTLDGTEASAETLSIRENAGAIELYDESAGAAASTWDLNPVLENGSVEGLDSSVTKLIEDTAANRPAAGTEGRIFFESDTGRVLYDDGSSWIELGLSESQISLANLASHAFADLTGSASLTQLSAILDANDDIEVAHLSQFDGTVTTLLEDTAANRPAAGTEGRIFFESDTGRVLYDNGTSWIEVGLSESQISHDNITGVSASDHHPESESDTDTQSGDGSTTTFTISHSLGSTPTAVSVQATSADANGDFHVSSKTSSSIDVTYASAPASGTSNLSWDVITHA